MMNRLPSVRLLFFTTPESLGVALFFKANALAGLKSPFDRN